ncbi:MAG: acetyl-CoA carboxylase biotin carboxyl carrier protein subunit [Bacteroidetes bacterium]|nr:acetyl-CoA carboxylase biotin carboxyl carrier protein subunit [Bacteroidota bacterium]
MLNITVNEKHAFEVTTGEKYLVNGEELSPDIAQISDTQFHVLLNNKSYSIVQINGDDPKNPIISVNGTNYTVGVKDRFDILLKNLGMDSVSAKQAADVKAPMPGLVLSTLVEVGEEVIKDTPLLILQAMKMENMIKSPGNGIIEKILVKAGDTVEKNQVLVKFKG